MGIRKRNKLLVVEQVARQQSSTNKRNRQDINSGCFQVSTRQALSGWSHRATISMDWCTYETQLDHCDVKETMSGALISFSASDIMLTNQKATLTSSAARKRKLSSFAVIFMSRNQLQGLLFFRNEEANKMHAKECKSTMRMPMPSGDNWLCQEYIRAVVMHSWQCW